MEGLANFLGNYFSPLFLIIILAVIILNFSTLSYKKKLGDIKFKTGFPTKKTKIFVGLFLALNILTIVLGIYYLSIGDNKSGYEFLIRGAVFTLMSIGFINNATFIVGENGFLLNGVLFYRWDNIKKVEIDKDIGQNMYGVKIDSFVKNKNQKIYIYRHLIDDFKKTISDKLSTERITEKVYS